LAAYLLIVLAMGYILNRDQAEDDRIERGRAVAIDVLCHVDQAIVQAGQQTISGGSSVPPALDRFLHGIDPSWPTAAERRERAQKNARLYAEHVHRAVAGAFSRYGLKTGDHVPPYGIDCGELLRAAEAADAAD
jgi:hypothetical protein